MIVKFEKQSLERNNKILSQFLDTVFDVAIIVDQNCNVVNYGGSNSELMTKDFESVYHHNIEMIDHQSPYRQVIETGLPVLNRKLVLNGHDCLQNIHPIMTDNQIIGAIAVATYIHINILKEQLIPIDKHGDFPLDYFVQMTTRENFDGNPLELSPEQMRNGDITLEPLLNVFFDSAIYINTKGIVSKCGMGKRQLTNEQIAELVNSPIKLFDPISPYDAVIQSGKAITNLLLIVFGRQCLSNLYPIFNKGKVIGVLGTIRFSDLDILKKHIKDLPDAVDSFTKEDIVARLKRSYTFDDFIGSCKKTEKLLLACEKISRTSYPVLLLGESGTGKEILAGAIHAANLGQTFKPYVKINCTAIPHDLLESELYGHEKGAFTGAASLKRGKFEIASGGTILLDEIGDMPLDLQSKLLRVLEDKVFERVGGTKEIELDVRIIASTNCDLYKKCKEGTFRLDLYYRLNTIEIVIPPLRERKEDIPELISYFLIKNDGNIGFHPDAMKELVEYSWPGNVRELRNVINRIAIWENGTGVNAKTVREYLHLEEKNLPSDHKDASIVLKTLLETEKDMINAALKEENFHLTNTAAVLGITRATLYNKLKKHGIKI